MHIELKICLSAGQLAGISAEMLSTLGTNLHLPHTDERSRVVFELVDDTIDPLLFIPARQVNPKRGVLIIVSPKLIHTEGDQCKASNAANRLLESFWSRTTLIGLIGVNAAAAEQDIAGLDGVVHPDHIADTLIETIQAVAARLWFKIPPPAMPLDKPRDGSTLRLVQVKDVETFEECLALRHQVYSSLGYLDDAVAEAHSKVELDCYDSYARHFAVVDIANDGHVVGTARLITPGYDSIFRRPAADRDAPFSEWCDKLARTEPTRVFRDILSKPAMSALPILDSFAYFNGLHDQERYQPLVMPQHACEVSRVVVAPDYRGLGILRMLMDEAIRAARDAGKRFLLLECAPFHEDMYRKFGFETIEDGGRCYYMRAQRLDSWAVAMHLDLNEDYRIQQTSNVCRVNVDRTDRIPLQLAISHPELNERDIEAHLQDPVTLGVATKDMASDIAKSGTVPLVAELRMALRKPNDAIDDALKQLYKRLPNARVRLLSGSLEHEIDNREYRDSRQHQTIIKRISRWLESLHGPN